MHVKKKQLPKVEPVKLKNLFGLKPGQWLTVLYALIFLLLLFFIGILPDLVHPSMRVNFTSSFGGQAVYIDGNYAGGTPFVKKVPSGNHSIEYSIDGIKTDNFDIKVKKAVFFNWLFPRTMKVSSNADMTKTAFNAVAKAFLNDVIAYSNVLDYDSTVTYPALFENFTSIIKDGNYTVSDPDYNRVLETALLFVTTQEMQDDASSALSKEVNIQTPSTPSYKVPVISRNSDGYMINNEFTIARSCVTEKEFAAFIAENPSWSKDNLSNLVQQGLADEYYLADFTESSEPVRNVSYYAAKAYTEWLSKKTGKNISLPTERQWTLACLVSDQTYQRTLVGISKADKPVSMLGGLWEMTSTYYVPGDRNSDSQVQAFLKDWSVTSDIVVKGGSYINKVSDVNAFTAGTCPMNLCSDFMGFRVVYN